MSSPINCAPVCLQPAPLFVIGGRGGERERTERSRGLSGVCFQRRIAAKQGHSFNRATDRRCSAARKKGGGDREPFLGGGEREGRQEGSGMAAAFDAAHSPSPR